MKICLATVFLAFAVSAGDFLSTHKPDFWHGGEFPGAAGRATVTNGVLALHYDFTKGGHYVSARFGLPERPVTRGVSLAANFSDETELTLRLVDATGQVFQRRITGAPGGWATLALALDDGGWGGCWGGAADHVFHQPATGFAVLAEHLAPGAPGGPVGELRVRDIAMLATAPDQNRPVFPAPLAEVSFDQALARARTARDQLAPQVAALEAKGLGAKDRATLGVIDYFLPCIQEDLARGFTNRAVREARELAQLAEAGVRRAQARVDGTVPDFPVPHYRTSKLETSHAQIVGDRVWPDGRVDRGPVFLTGAGHFGRVQRELDRLPTFGNHILQMEIGPSHVLTAEDKVDLRPIEAFCRMAERAASNNVAVTLLLSPHYFPGWAFAKWPHLKACGGGFLHQCVYAPEARAVEEKFLRTLVPRVRACAALHSFCLSNEPETHVYANCPELRRRWPVWLAQRYGSLAAFNAQMKTSYATFAEVPLPAGFDNNAPSPLLAAFQAFNTEQFADWHRWMADVVHELAPEVPVHAKIMINPTLWENNATFMSVDPAAFASFSQYHGNDSYDFYRGGTGWGWIHDWVRMQAGYDSQRSTADLPVFNTENHIHPDRSQNYLPGAHTYTVLWQNALHGQSATTLWCWERAYDKEMKSDVNGLVLERPEALEAWAHAALDLSRLADAFAPLQNLPPSVLIHWSPASFLRGEASSTGFFRVYEAANFLGQALGFARDDALAAYGRTGQAVRPLDQARVILLPSQAPVPADVQKGLDRFVAAGGRVVRVPAKHSGRMLHAWLAAASSDWKLPSAPTVRETDADRPVWGVETRGYLRPDGTAVMSVCNHLCAPKTVRLPAAGTDLVTGAAVPATVEVPPLRPMLLVFKPWRVVL